MAHLGDIGTTLIVNCGEDLSSATTMQLYIRKPDGTEVIKDATIYNSTYLRYATVSGDLDQSGNYLLQSYVITPSWTGKGNTASFVVKGNYEQ